MLTSAATLTKFQMTRFLQVPLAFQISEYQFSFFLLRFLQNAQKMLHV